MQLKALLVLAVALTCFVAAASAQEITGTISGTVTDPSGAAVPEAKVSVTSQQTSAMRTTVTTTAGVFFFNSVAVGDYRLLVEKAGFKKYEMSRLHLDVNDKLNLNISLQVGEVNERVTVTAQPQQLQTETAEVSNLIGSGQILDLPLNGRDFNQLVDLVPGIAPDQGRVANGVGLFSDTNVSVNGNESNSNLFLVDGEYNLDSGANGNLLVTPSIDSIEEFKILRNNYSAEFGGATGGIINVITRSGTQQFHGSVFEFFRNDKLDATDPFLHAAGQQKSELRLNNFGFTGGGPIWIPGHYNQDKTKDFLFTSFEWRREVRGGALHDIVPTARQQQGVLDPSCAVTPGPCTPQAADPFESPILGEPNVDPSLIDPNSIAFLSRYPAPNAPISSGFNFLTSGNLFNLDHQALVRWDHNFGTRTVFTARYMQMVQALNGINNQLFGLMDNFPSVNTDWKWYGKNVVLKVTTTLTPHLLNDFQFGYSNNALGYVTGSTSNPTLASRAGFTYTEFFPETSGSFPTLNAVEQFGLIQNTAPFNNRTDNFQYKDDLAYAFGKHNLKFGAFLRFNRKHEPANGAGNFTAGSFTFQSFSDFLQGINATYQEEKTQNFVNDRARDYGLYVQDTWKMTNTLTLNLGLRWEYLPPIFSASDNIGNFRPDHYQSTQCSPAAFTPDGLIDPALCNTVNGIVTPKTPGISRSTLQSHKNDWEPRLGLAWQPPVKNLVVRAGFGMYHGRDAVSETSALGFQPPFDANPTINGVSYAALAPFNPATPQPPLSLFALDPVYNNPLSYQYSLGVQYQLMTNTTLEVDYVGSHQIHLGRNRNINQISVPDQLLVADGTISNPDTVRPFLGYNFINFNERAGTASYNSLQVFFSRRMSRGVQFQASYTFSRDLSDTINQDTEFATGPIQDAFNPRADRGPTNQDQTHSLTFNYIWELPFFSKESGWKHSALGGWEIVGITTFRSGLPTTVCLDTDNAALGTPGYTCERPDLFAKPTLDRGKRSVSEFFNTAAFVQPIPGTFGNSERNDIRLPGVNNWDLSIFKNFAFPWAGRHKGWAFGEDATLQFRAEFFNVWNHVQYNSVNTTFVTQGPGLPATPNTGFGQITGAREPREIQLALKLIW